MYSQRRAMEHYTGQAIIKTTSHVVHKWILLLLLLKLSNRNITIVVCNMVISDSAI